MVLNTILTIGCFVVVAIISIVMYISARGRKQIVYEEQFAKIEDVLEGVKKDMVETIKEDISLGADEQEFNRLYKRKARINDALKKCVYGIDSAKALVIDLIRGFVDENVKDINVDKMLGLDEESEPSDHVMFEILMYRYKKRYGKGAIAQWIDNNTFDRERISPDSTRVHDKAYFITCEDLQQSYLDENIELTMDEKRDVLSVLVYQLYKGFGILDTLREMDINGFNVGTSGSILAAVNNARNMQNRANNSVWLYFRGKYIHLKFMNFGSEDELRRIIQLMIRYNNPGSLTAKRGAIVNTMYDKSRILALRPPASEYWAIFVRKFTLSDVSPEALIIKPYTKRGEITVKLVEFLLRGKITCAITGRQGSGKTTFMSSVIRYIDPRYTIRVLELAPELYLRELYPTRNILSVQETQAVTAAELQDYLKKSDASVSIVGEVATDQVAARMIQMGMTASIFTLFTHHANTPKDLVLTLRNSLANAGNFNNMETAEKQVTDVVKVDIHLDYTPDGKRFISRISEIVQLDSNTPYPEFDEPIPEYVQGEEYDEYMKRLALWDRKLQQYKVNLDKEYYYRQTDRVAFETREILRYNLDTDTYECVDRFSPWLENVIRANLGKEMALEFDYFMLRNWGLRKEDEEEEIDFGGNLETFLDELEGKIDDNLAQETKAMGVKSTNLEDIIDMDEGITTVLSRSTEYPDIADEFSIGLFS